MKADHPYDGQSPEEQRRTRRRWDEEFARSRARLNYERRFEAEGSAYSEADADGNLVRHPASPPAAN